MKLYYNVTGQERKSLVGAISQELNTPSNYLAAPTFAYEVGCYHIDKAGTVTGPDNLDLEADLQGIHGFIAAEREYDEPDTYESGLGGMGALPSIEELQMTEEEELGLGRTRRENSQGENGMQASDVPELGLVIEIPRTTFTDTALENLKRLIESKAALFKKAFGVENLALEISDDRTL